MKGRIPVLVLAVLAFVLASAMLSASALGDSRRPPALPPDAHPYGQSYSEWAADWWQWVLTQPVATNPVLDETGARCANGQSGPVWFLAGAFASGTVSRSCTVPTGTALLFPVVNYFYCALETDPPEQRTVEFARAQTSFVRDSASGLSATIDGVAVPDVTRYFEDSVVFTAVLPADNLFGLPAGTLLAPCVDAGFYVMVPPLSKGEHTIQFSGTLASLISLDVTYQLTVA